MFVNGTIRNKYTSWISHVVSIYRRNPVGNKKPAAEAVMSSLRFIIRLIFTFNILFSLFSSPFCCPRYNRKFPEFDYLLTFIMKAAYQNSVVFQLPFHLYKERPENEDRLCQFVLLSRCVILLIFVFNRRYSVIGKTKC